MLVAGPYGKPKPETSGRRRNPRQVFPETKESREVFAEHQRLKLSHLGDIAAALRYLCVLGTVALVAAVAYGVLTWIF